MALQFPITQPQVFKIKILKKAERITYLAERSIFSKFNNFSRMSILLDRQAKISGGCGHSYRLSASSGWGDECTNKYKPFGRCRLDRIDANSSENQRSANNFQRTQLQKLCGAENKCHITILDFHRVAK